MTCNGTADLTRTALELRMLECSKRSIIMQVEAVAFRDPNNWNRDF